MIVLHLFQFVLLGLAIVWVVAPFVALALSIHILWRFAAMRREIEQLREDVRQRNGESFAAPQRATDVAQRSRGVEVQLPEEKSPFVENVDVPPITDSQPVTEAKSPFENLPRVIECSPPQYTDYYPPTDAKPAAVDEKPATFRPKSEVSAEVSALELLIGRKVMLWAAMVLFVLVAAFFVKYAVDHNWVSDTLKVVSIGLFGCFFLAAGKYFSVSGLRRLSVAISSAGIAIVFMAGYVSYNYYELIPVQFATGMMVAIVVAGMLLSYHYLSRLLGVVSVFGGLAVPMLVPATVDLYLSFFSYLLALNIGSVVLLNVMKRAPIGCVAFLGTQFEFWLWYSRCYEPEKLGAVIGFQVVLYLIYLVDTAIASLTPLQKTTWDDATRAVLSPVILGQCVWYFLRHDEFFNDWLGIFAFAFAGFYAILAVLFTQHLRRIWNPQIAEKYSTYWVVGPVAATIIAVMFATVGIPLQFHARWIALGWYVLTSGLWFAGFRFRQTPFLVLATLIYLLAFGWYVTHDIPIRLGTYFGARFLFDAEILAGSLLPSILISVVCIGTAILTKPWIFREKRQTETNFVLNSLRGLEGILIAWMILSFAVWHYFTEHPISFWENIVPATPEFVSHAMLAVLWTIFATVLFGIGIAVKSPEVRKLGLAGYVLVCGKIYFLQLFLRVNWGNSAVDGIATYSEPLNFESWQYCMWNPWFVTIAVPIGVMVLLAVLANVKMSQWWHEWRQRQLDSTDTSVLKILGFNGLVVLWFLLTVECFTCVWSLRFTDFSQFLAICWTPRAAVTVLWCLYGAGLMGIGIAARSRNIRTFAGFIFGITGLKILLTDIIRASSMAPVVWNSYCVPISLYILVIYGFTIWANRLSKQAEPSEKTGYTALGIFATVLLWLVASFECFGYFDAQVQWPHHNYIGVCAVSVFWTLLGGLLVTVGLNKQWTPVRYLGYTILILTILKACSVEIVYRPRDLYPFLNTFSLSLFSLSFTVIMVSLFSLAALPPKFKVERMLVRIFGFGGLALLWVSSSMECHSSILALSGNSSESLRQAQMSVSILWSLFGGALITIGFRFRSAVLRWLAIILFGLTTMKVLMVDMQGLDQLYRIGAFFVLAVVLFLAAWAYQRFRMNDNI